ncbi:MAG TPA: hypothetical protein VFA04_11395 [Bryobacteraceae bacterium]|nr:hypothetical protein [Bryobacteraceae bacterium]
MKNDGSDDTLASRTYLCRLTTAGPSAMKAEIRLRAAGYQDAIDKAVRAFRNDPDFNAPPVRATLSAYPVTSSGIDEGDAAFRFILPDEWE